MKRILFAASECVPFIKTGGLADVCGALPKEFSKEEWDVRVVIPNYSCIPEKYRSQFQYVTHFYMCAGNYIQNKYVGILKYELDGVTYYFIDNQEYFTCDTPYGDIRYDIEKFVFFDKAVLSMLKQIDFRPDLIHCHDWETGLIPVYLKNEFFSKSCKYMINKQQEIRKHILTIGNDVVKQNLKEIDDLEKNPQKDEKKRLAWLKETRKKLNSSLKNPRKVKRYLNNIENMLSVADTVWFQKENFETNEYSKEPWEKYIIKISFLKAFLTEEYEAMIGAGNFYFFKENDERNYYINERIMCIYDDSDGIYEISMNGILEELVYHLYIMDIDLYKSKHQELTNEIDNEKLKEKNILQYIEICMGIQIDFVRTNKVLDYIIESNIEDKDNLLKIINCIINRINFNEEGKFALGNILCGITPINGDQLSAKFLYYYLNHKKDKLYSK